MRHSTQKNKATSTECDNKNFRTWKKGKIWLYGCSVAALAVSSFVTPYTASAVATVGSSLISDSFSAENEVEAGEDSLGSESSGVSESSDTGINDASDRSDLVKDINYVYAVSSDITFLQYNSDLEVPASQTLSGYSGYTMGAKGTFTAKTKDLVAGNTLVVAEVTQTSDSSGALASFGYANSVPILDSEKNEIGSLQYFENKLIIYIYRTGVFNGETFPFSFNTPSLLAINRDTPTTVRETSYSNKVSVSGRSYEFNFTAIPKTNVADANYLFSDSAPRAFSYSSSVEVDYSHDNSVIPSTEAFNELQGNLGKSGNLLENKGIMESLRITSDDLDMSKFVGTSYGLGTYYVSSITHKIQGKDFNGTHITPTLEWAYSAWLVRKPMADGLTIPELQAAAKSGGSGVYYSYQGDGSYLFVNYYEPSLLVLSDEQIKNSARQNDLSEFSQTVDADVEATLAYYQGAIQNRATTVSSTLRLEWADQFAVNTLTAQVLDDNGKPIGDSIVTTSTPYGSISGNTSVKTNCVDLDGKSLQTTNDPNIWGAPTDKKDALGFSSSEMASVSPATIPGYTLVSSLDKLTKEQKEQLDNTLSKLGISSAVTDTSKKAIFATGNIEVAFPGFSGSYYDADGNPVTADKGTEGFGQTNVYYFYVASLQNVSYQIIDDSEAGKELGDEVIFEQGNSGDALKGTQADIEAIGKAYSPDKYEFVKADTLPTNFDSDTNTPQVVQIHVKHKTKSETETKTVNRVIHYVFPEGADIKLDDVTDTVTFTRTKTTDLATNAETHGNWTVKSGNPDFKEVQSPAQAGYTPDKTSIKAVTVTGDSSDIPETVTYTADNQKIFYNIIDDTDNKQLESQLFEEGASNAPLTKTKEKLEAIGKAYSPDKYEFVTADELPTNFDSDSSVTEFVDIHVKHKIKTETLTKTVHQTIKYVFPEGTNIKVPDVTNALTFTRTKTTDLANGNETLSAWNEGNQTFKEIESPSQPGYTPDKSSIGEREVNGDSSDIPETVTYKGNQQKVLYTVFDDTEGDTVVEEVPFDEGPSNTALTKTQADLQAIADAYSSDDYKVEIVDPLPTGFDSDDAKDQIVGIHLTHKTKVETETRTVSRTIRYIMPDLKTRSTTEVVDKVSFTREVTTDLVTNVKTPGAWTAVDGDTTFDAVVTPDVPGYTPDIDLVPEKTGVTGDSKDTTIPVTYAADDQKVVYNVVDDTEQKELVTGETFDIGKTNQPLSKTSEDLQAIAEKYEAEGYEVGPIDPLPERFDAADEDEVVTIHLTHKIITVTADNPGELELSKKITETIHYEYEDGKPALDDLTDSVEFRRSAQVDAVTDAVISQSDWAAVDDDVTFSEKTSPEIKNYTPDLSSIEEITGLTPDSENKVFTVTYKKDAQPVEDKPEVPAEPTKPSNPPTVPSAAAPASQPSVSRPNTPIKATVTAPVIKKTSTSIKLPSTGDSDNKVMTAAAALSLIAAGLLSRLKLRRKKH
jgi:LPXTG-motif cell wall-anchored protein